MSYNNSHDSVYQIRKELGLPKRRMLKPEDALKFVSEECVTTIHIMSKLNVCRAYAIFLLDKLCERDLVEKILNLNK